MPVPTITTAPFPVLQPESGIVSGSAYLPASPENVLWGRLPSRGDAPVLTVAPGQTIVVDTVSHEGMMSDQGSDPLGYFRHHGVPAEDILSDTVDVAGRVTRSDADGPHIVTGPIAVAGALPGDLLAVRIDKLSMRVPYGVISTRHAKGVLSGDSGLDGTYSQFCSVEERSGSWYGTMPLHPDAGAEKAAFPLAPFLGIMGVAADSDTRAHSVPPGLHGGNIDIKVLTEGATLYLPVQVPDALFYIGDPHYAQGNGEVALTALEAPLRATLTVQLVPAAEIGSRLAGVAGPFATAGDLLVPTGLHEDLNVALRHCVTNGIELLTGLFGMERRLAYLYLSAAADFQISQAVDQVRGVHGQIRVSDFPALSRTPLGRTLLGPLA